MKEILNVIHNTIYHFFDVCSDDEEVPMSDKDKLLLEVNKAICNNLKALEQQPCEDCISREAVDEYITNLLSGYLYDEERTRLEDLTAFVWKLPSVTPKAEQQPCEDCTVIKKLSKKYYVEDAYGYTDEDIVKKVNEIIDVVNESSSVTPKAEQKWIPVSERLPDYGVSVLTWDGYCYYVEKRIPYIRDEDGEPISSDWWVSDEYDECDSDYYPNLRDGACIAWMPLPEPYKAESEEEDD